LLFETDNAFPWENIDVDMGPFCWSPSTFYFGFCGLMWASATISNIISMTNTCNSV
jgi:hypothetical protein